MKIGFICINGPGHLNPMTALARQLQARNHDVAHIAHEIHHAYLHWINPQNYVDARQSLTAEAEQEKAVKDTPSK